jgi:hypothetical protein
MPVLRLTAVLFAVAVAVAAICPALAAPSSDLWPRWQTHDPRSHKGVDHGPWQRFLDRYVVRGADGINRVRYGAVSRRDRGRLDAYIERLTGLPISRYNRSVQRAVWINLYNALTVKVVLDHYPVRSIRDIDISPGFFSDGPWGRKLVTIEGEKVSLDDIEHRILRPIWKDVRIHYALNCAALGCPDLGREAYTAINTGRLLNEAAGRFVNHPRGVRFEKEGLVASSIYDWYRADFGGSAEGVLRHLVKYARMPLAPVLAVRTEIARYEYDWRLNDAAAAPSAKRP